MSDGDNHPFPCRFPRCQKPFKQLPLLKNHLRIILGSGGDKRHPLEHEEWTKITSENFLARVPRLGDKDTDEEEDQTERRHASQRKHYDRHKEVILPMQRTRQKVARQRAKLCNQVGEIADKAITAVLKSENALNDVLHQAMLNRKFICTLFTRPKSLTEFAYLDQPVSLQRFPRMIAYLLPSDIIPPIIDATPGDILINVLPNQSHFRKASILVHADKGPGGGDFFKFLSEGWRMWKPYFHNYVAFVAGSESEVTTEAMDLSSGEMDREVEGEVVLDEAMQKEVATLTLWDGEQEEAVFRGKGESYGRLADMYWAYHIACADALETLYPKQISPWSLELAFQDLEEAERKAKDIEIDTSAVKAEEVGSLIKEAIEGEGAQPKKRGRKRKHPVDPDSSDT